MTMTDTSSSAAWKMLKRIGSTPFPDGFQNIADDAERMIAAQADHIIELETALDAPNRHAYNVGVSVGRAAARAEAVRELHAKWIVRDLTAQDFFPQKGATND